MTNNENVQLNDRVNGIYNNS